MSAMAAEAFGEESPGSTMEEGEENFSPVKLVTFSFAPPKLIWDILKEAQELLIKEQNKFVRPGASRKRLAGASSFRHLFVRRQIFL